MGQRELLTALIGDKPDHHNFTLVFDLKDPAQFERAYRIADSMRPCYKTEPYYLPTYHKLREAYAAKDPVQMHWALTNLCIDIIHR